MIRLAWNLAGKPASGVATARKGRCPSSRDRSLPGSRLTAPVHTVYPPPQYVRAKLVNPPFCREVETAYGRAVPGALILATSLIVAVLLWRGLEPWRPADAGRLAVVVGAAIVSPVVVIGAVAIAERAGGTAATFLAFFTGVVLIAYMFLAGAWALRFLADSAARYR